MKVFMTAGEASGDKLGAALIDGLRKIDPDIELMGIAGPLMRAKGMNSLFDMSELSVMGLAEILPKYAHLKRRIAQTAQAVIDTKPDVLVTIDSPDFSLRVAKLVKAQSDIPTVHYVAPTVWAWRAGRAKKMAKHIDHVLALFPFEPPYMTDVGMSCDFVGHPVVAEPAASSQDIAQLFRDTKLDPDRPILLVLPGSRRGEVTRIGPIFMDSIARFLQDHSEFQVLGVATDQTKDLLADHLHGTTIIAPDGGDVEAFQRLKRAAFARADIALAASGTVSLELAAAKTPMVIAYDMNRLTRMILKRMLKTDTVTLVNLVADSRYVPEYLGAACRADLIAPALATLWQDPTLQDQAMALSMVRLGQGAQPPGIRAAQSIMDFLAKQ